MSPLEALWEKEGIKRHLLRILTALAKAAPKGELRIYAVSLLAVEDGEAVTEILDDATGEVVLRYAGRGSQHLIVRPAAEQAWPEQDNLTPASPRRAIKSEIRN